MKVMTKDPIKRWEIVRDLAGYQQRMEYGLVRAEDMLKSRWSPKHNTYVEYLRSLDKWEQPLSRGRWEYEQENGGLTMANAKNDAEVYRRGVEAMKFLRGQDLDGALRDAIRAAELLRNDPLGEISNPPAIYY